MPPSRSAKTTGNDFFRALQILEHLRRSSAPYVGPGCVVWLAVKPQRDTVSGVWEASNGKSCIAPGSLDTSLSHAAGLSDIAVCHA